MKRIVFIITALSMLSIVSCNNEKLDNIDKGVKEFVAYTDVQTKATLAEDGLSTVWEDGDEISINDVNYITYQGGPCGIFTFNNAPIINDGKFPATNPFYAGYPYAYILSHNEECIEFGNHIYYDEDNNEYFLNVDNDRFVDGFFSIAYNEEEPVLKFKNIMSVLKFKVPDKYSEDIKSIEISVDNTSGNNALENNTLDDSALGADMTVHYNNGEPVIVDMLDINYSCILRDNSNKSNKFELGGIYYVPLIPGKKKDLTFKINGKEVGKINEIVCKRSVIHNLGTLPTGSN